MEIRLTENLVLQKTRVDNLRHVKNLNLWGSDLSDVSILRDMPNVEVLSLSVNKIQTLRDFSNCMKLRELYLRKNDVRELSEVRHLEGLPSLRILWLNDNPCADAQGYRSFVIRMLTHLEKLDDIDVTSTERMAAAKLTDQECRMILQRQAAAVAASAPAAPPIPLQQPPPAVPPQQVSSSSAVPMSGRPVSIPRKKESSSGDDRDREELMEKPKSARGQGLQSRPPQIPASPDDISGGNNNGRRKWNSDNDGRPIHIPPTGSVGSSASGGAPQQAPGGRYVPSGDDPPPPKVRDPAPIPPPPRVIAPSAPIPSSGGSGSNREREPSSQMVPPPSSNNMMGPTGGYLPSAGEGAGAQARVPVLPGPPKAKPRSGPAGGGHRTLSSQKNILTAILSLLNELNAEGLDIVHQEVTERLSFHKE